MLYKAISLAVLLAFPCQAATNLMFGVNLAGGEFSIADYPNAADFDYFHSKGLNLIRLPFKWERVQPTLNGALSTTEMAKLDACVNLATARGMNIILDMHNYGVFNGVEINSGSVTYAAYRDVWTKLAARYNGNATIWAYGLMNEPSLASATWTAAAQQAINGIRTVDTGHTILVAWWMDERQAANTDTANKLMYEAHRYFDANNDGVYGTYDGENAHPNIGIDRMDPFLNWCIGHRAKGFIGEYGIPRTDSRWNVVLDNFLSYCRMNGFSGTYWAAGHAWLSNYSLRCDPVGGVEGQQISILTKYTTATYAGNYSGEVFSYGGSTTTGNLAVGKKAYSCSDFGPAQSRWKGIDNDPATYWASRYGELPAFLAVDLGQNLSVNQFIVNHGGSTYNTRDFKIQSSTDGVSWTDRVTVAGNTANTTTHTINAISARYFRIWITAPSSSTTVISRIKEFQVINTGSAGGTQVYEAEAVATVSSSDTITVLNETGLSGGRGELLNANAVGDYVSYTVPSIPAGSYHVRIGVKTHDSLRGQFQLSIDGVNQGAVQDECSTSGVYVEFPVGTKTLTAGSHVFNFTITGKNAASSSYAITVDSIKLIPQ